MKKIICLMLVIFTVLSMVACGNVEDPSTDDDVTTGEENTKDTVGGEEEETTTEEATTEEATTEEVIPPEEFVDNYDGVFQTGYARTVITPTNLPAGKYTTVADDLYATCIAVNDGDKTALFISLDLKSLMPNHSDSVKNKVSQVAKVPVENIFVSVTHTHSTIEIGSDQIWSFGVFTKIANAAKEAIKDLADSEIFVGTGATPGATFVRRYIHRDGSMSSINPNEGGALRCVKDPDDSLQVVRFVREDKKDIVLLNWQGHLAHADNEIPEEISADIAHYLREDIESADKDTLVALFVGASGNINLTPPNERARRYSGYVEVAHAISKEALRLLDGNLARIAEGKINIKREVYAANNKVDTQEEIAAAQNRLNTLGSDYSGEAADRYIVARNKTTTSDLRMGAVSFGDLAFITAPYEMFDNNGEQIKEGSPFKMTFILTNSDGAWAYMPSIEAWEKYGGYETQITYFAPGTAEILVSKFLGYLGELKTVS